METIKANLQQNIVSFSGFDIKTKIVNGIEKKDVKNLPPWKQITKDTCIKYTGLNVAVVCGRISAITVIDFDNMTTYEQVIKDFPELQHFKQVRTRNGVHIYGLYCEDLHTTTKAFEMYTDIDIRNDDSIVFAPPTKYCLLDGTTCEYKDMGGEILEFPHDLIQKQKYIQKELLKKKKEEEKSNKIQKKIRKQIENEPCGDMYQICLKIINAGLLDQKCDNYDDWIKVGFAIFNSLKEFELFDLFSKRSSKYDAISVKTKWDSMKERLEDGLSFLSILFWAEECDNELFKSLNINFHEVREKDNEQTFIKKSKLFEQYHCKIINEGLYIHEENNEIKVLSETDIRNHYKHIRCGYTKMGNPINFIERWLVNNNDIRNKKTMGIHIKNCPDNAYNLWTPFIMDLKQEYIPKPEAIELFKEHIQILCNHEQAIVDFVIHWIAFMIQYPEKKSKMLVFISDEGAGKNTLLEIIKHMIGNKKVFESTDPSRDVWGNFNGQMVDAFLVNLNEISALDFKNANGKVKGLITDPTLTINEKCVKPFKIQSYHHFITSTNNEEAIKPSKNDRRNCLIRCSDELIKRNKTPEQVACINTYLKNIYAMMKDDDSIKTIFEWLKSIPDLEDFFSVDFPLTDFHKTQTELSVSPIELWLRDYVVNHEGLTSHTESSKLVYSDFKSWVGHNMPHYECSIVQFGVRLTNFNKTLITSKPSKYGAERTFNIPELYKLLFPKAENKS